MFIGEYNYDLDCARGGKIVGSSPTMTLFTRWFRYGFAYSTTATTILNTFTNS